MSNVVLLLKIILIIKLGIRYINYKDVCVVVFSLLISVKFIGRKNNMGVYRCMDKEVEAFQFYVDYMPDWF